MTELIV